ncbi:MAG: outer membrane beta-barrel protein [Bacteriovorax sp.]
MQKLVLISAIWIIAFSAQAAVGGAFLEPLVSYETGTGDVSFPPPINSSDSKVRGFGLGARAGIQALDVLFVGIDGRYSFPKFKDANLSQDIKSNAWNLGPMVGIQMPTIVGLRFFGTWILTGELDPDKDKGVDEKFKSANGFRLGGGFRIGLISLNAEYQYVKYDETTIEQVGVFNPGFNANDIQLSNKSFIFSVSFPIGI